jgi:hypothetical protein
VRFGGQGTYGGGAPFEASGLRPVVACHPRVLRYKPGILIHIFFIFGDITKIYTSCKLYRTAKPVKLQRKPILGNLGAVFCAFEIFLRLTFHHK